MFFLGADTIIPFISKILPFLPTGLLIPSSPSIQYSFEITMSYFEDIIKPDGNIDYIIEQIAGLMSDMYCLNPLYLAKKSEESYNECYTDALEFVINTYKDEFWSEYEYGKV